MAAATIAFQKPCRTHICLEQILSALLSQPVLLAILFDGLQLIIVEKMG
jgi:hypothetical protein